MPGRGEGRTSEGRESPDPLAGLEVGSPGKGKEGGEGKKQRGEMGWTSEGRESQNVQSRAGKPNE